MKKTKGFTLIELLIVVVILGILAVFVFLTLGGALQKPKDARAKTALSEVSKALEQYKAVNENKLTGICGGVASCTFLDASGISTLKTRLTDGGVMSFQASELIDAQGVSIRITAVESSGNYELRGKSAKTASKCWKVSSVSGTVTNNFSESTPALNCGY